MPSAAPCASASGSLSSSGDDVVTHELGDLEGGKPCAAGGAKYGDRLALPQLSAVLEPMQRRVVGHRNAGRGLIAHATRNRNRIARLCGHLFPDAVAADRGDDFG